MIGSTLGLIRDATIKDVNVNRGTMRVVINLARGDAFDRTVDVPIPSSWSGPGGEFSGGYPTPGSTIKIQMGQGGEWSSIGYAPSNDVYGNKNITMSSFRQGRHLIQTRNNIKHIVGADVGVNFGDTDQYVHADPNIGILSNTFDSNMSFTEASRKINGPVYRDVQYNAVRNISGSSLNSHEYQKSLVEIGLDPRTRAGDSFIRNPAFNENREIIYEFKNSIGFTDDNNEIRVYDGEIDPHETTGFFKRRESRADALSLSLVEPNQLIESIKGTVVDVYGNVLDLNRSILPNGILEGLSFRDNETSTSNTFINLREQTRKSIAYHFEINARKEDIPDLSDIGEYANNSSDYARNRSKFFVDIDKEGQFKINVPSSSETGNVGLLVRHENYSTIKAAEDGSDPREFVRNSTNQDIFIDSFGVGVISLIGGEGGLEGFSSPVDRLHKDDNGKEVKIKLGTAYHDLTKTLELHSFSQPILQYPDSKINTVSPITTIVSPEIIVSGKNANAGGRSGTISLDGHLSLNIGANTIDRQSLWMDFAGGMVTNVGRDLRDVSWAGRFDGDVLLQIGGSTPSGDSRFLNVNNAIKDGVLDLRVFTSNQMHVIRIDNSGVSVFTPGSIDIVSDGAMSFKSRRNNMYFDAENIYFYANDRNSARYLARKPGKVID